MSTLQKKVASLIRTSVRNEDSLIHRLTVVEQTYPEAMFADQVVELEVRQLDAAELGHLMNTLVNNGFAVQTISFQLNTVTHLRIWSLDGRSACSRQRDMFLAALLGFEFTDGWTWRGDDPRDLIYELPRRLPDERTWVCGAYYGLEDGGPHGIWNRGTFAVTFADRNGTEVVEVAIYIKNGSDVFKMTPGKSFAKCEGVPVPLF